MVVFGVVGLAGNLALIIMLTRRRNPAFNLRARLTVALTKGHNLLDYSLVNRLKCDVR